MMDAIANGVTKGIASCIAALLTFPFYLGLTWWINYLGWIAWAGFPEPTWRQMIVLAAVAAFIGS